LNLISLLLNLKICHFSEDTLNMLCYAGVCACGRSMFCKHLEGEVWYWCGAR